MEKKQSSIDWFAKKLAKQGLLLTEDSEYIVAYLEAKAMHKEEQNNKINLAINEFERLKSKAESIRDIIYLDGVLAVLDSIKNETFGGDNE